MKAPQVAVVVVMAAVLAGCGGGGNSPATSSATPTTIQVRGTLVLSTTSLGGGSLEDLTSGAAPCKGTGGYDDIGQGTQVTVTDEAGKVVGVGALGAGQYNSVSGSCTFEFTVAGVAPGRAFYGVEVAHRGVIRYEGGKVASPQLQLGDGQ